MEELHMSHKRSKEQRIVTAQSKHQQSRVFHMLKGAAAMMPSRSSPSPTSPFVHLDSPSSASLSHLAPRSHSSAHNFPQPIPPHCLTAESDASSASAFQTISPPHEVPVRNVCSQGVSLEQHLQHGDAGREEAMQSFILERFLPAAKTVAADHDHTVYSAGRRPMIATSSSIMKAVPVHYNKSTSNFYASKNVTWLDSVYEDDEGYDDSVNSEMPAKSCGFFCAGLKSAMPRTHNIVHTATQDVSRNKSRPLQSSSHGTSSDEVQNVKVVTQGSQKQRGVFGPAPTSVASGSLSSITIQDALTSRAASLSKSFARAPAGDCVESLTHCNTRPSLNRCIKCHSSSFLHQTPIKGPSLGDSIAIWQSAQTFRCMCPSDDVGVGCDHPNCQWNSSNPRVSSDNSLCGGEVIKESLSVSESSLKDGRYPEDDELEFFDASSRFDVARSTESNVPRSQECKFQALDGQAPLCFDEHNLVEIVLPSIREGGSLAFDADHEGHVEIPWREQSEKSGKESLMVQHNCKINSRQGNARPLDGARSSMLYSCEKNTPREYDKSSSSPKPGWPLGIASFQSGTRKARSHETKNFGDECATNTKFQSAKMAEEQWTLSGRCLTDSNTRCANIEEEKKHCEKCAARTSFSLDVLAPPVPPSPTTSSWLEKVLASKASKPSYITTLRQEEKVVSAQKGDFIMPLERKKELRWEDVVKGSHMYPEHFSFSEEIRHHHPATEDAIKPLTF